MSILNDILFPLLVIALLIWGFYNEVKFIEFEDRWARRAVYYIKRKLRNRIK